MRCRPARGGAPASTRAQAELAALADQAWLSLLGFAVSLAFIRAAPKEEFAAYVLLLTPIFLAQGLQNALFLSPQATVLPAAGEARRASLRATSAALQAAFGLAVALLGALLLPAYRFLSGQAGDPLLALAFGGALLGALAREGLRAARYVEGRAPHALREDLVYGLLLLAGLAGLLAGEALTARNVLAALALAGVLPLARAALGRPVPRPDAAAWRQLWACGRWALPGVLLTWVNLNAYVYVAAAALGAAALADINAARLLLMPAGLAITAWSNLARPRISALHAVGEVRAIRRRSLVSIAWGGAALAGFVALVALAYPWLESFLGTQYRGLLPLVLVWGGFFLLNLPRSVLMASLMTDAAGYRALHHYAWLALLLGLPGLLLLAPRGPLWVIGVLCAVELLMLGLVGRSARARWRGGD